jgi:glutamine synthetase
MSRPQVTSTKDALRLAEERKLTHVNVGLFDVDGLLRAKRISLKKLASVLDKGLMFCDVIYGWDLHDQIYDNVRFTGWHTGFPDCPVTIYPQTCRDLPFEPGGLFFFGELAGAGAAIDPRAAVGRILERLESHGMRAAAGFEYEFFIFEETPDSVRAKGYRDLRPLSPGFFGYSGLRSLTHSELYNEILAVCEQMGLPLEGLHEESGAGVLEAAITVDDALRSADNAALFKAAIKVLCQRRGLMATFMARWSPDWPGQSGHIHLSLSDGDGNALFHDEAAEHAMSKTMRHFIAGQQALMPELLALVCPTINSYRRLIPGYWAPTSATWGIENRTCALRAIPGPASSQRVEYRIAPADANPYAALAAALGSGLWGIERELEPDAPIEGNAYDLPPDGPRALPATLWDAAQRLKGSDAARDLFGPEFVDHFAATREWEEREFRKHISDWELARYFEAI